MPWFCMTLAPHGLCPGHHGLDDVVVAGAAADVAFQLVANGILVRVRMALHEVDGAHDHARRAEAALQGLMPAEGRSEERRVGKECVSTCSSRGSPHHLKTKSNQKSTHLSLNSTHKLRT